MGDYKEDPNAKDDELTIQEEELRNKIIRKQQVQTKVNEDVPSACKKYESFHGDVQSASTELERPKTPEYDELNRRFQSLLCSMNTRTHSEISGEDEDDVFLEQSLPPGHVQLSCSKPPDILDFTRRSVSDILYAKNHAFFMFGTGFERFSKILDFHDFGGSKIRKNMKI